MKRLLLFFGITIAISAITWVLKAQDINKSGHPIIKSTPKSYEVKLTLDQWQAVMNGLESIKNAVKTSNMPAAQSTFISDSLISTYQNEFGRQIQFQLAAEQKAKTEVKKDSTNKKK